MNGLKLLACVALAAALCAHAFADEGEDSGNDKPAYKFRGGHINVSVTIDEALKKYPGLSDNLLAEGKRDAAKWDAQANEGAKKYKDLYRDHHRDDYERGYSERSLVLDRYVSIIRGDYIDGHGAHPNHFTDTILWDTQEKKRISIRPFFKETADNGATMTALAKAIRLALAAEKKTRDIEVKDPDADHGLSAVKPSLTKIGGVALAPSSETGTSAGLICYFSPYAVGAYVEGDYTVFIPWTAFKEHLSPEGAALFGGERPQGDADKD
jgi:hypothetical protein